MSQETHMPQDFSTIKALNFYADELERDNKRLKESKRRFGRTALGAGVIVGTALGVGSTLAVQAATPELNSTQSTHDIAMNNIDKYFPVTDQSEGRVAEGEGITELAERIIDPADPNLGLSLTDGITIFENANPKYFTPNDSGEMKILSQGDIVQLPVYVSPDTTEPEN